MTYGYSSIRLTFIAFLGVFSLLTVGCASTGSGASTSVLANSAPAQFQKTPLSTDALVVLRYPAAVDDKAKADYYQAYRNRAIGGDVKSSKKDVDTDQVAEGMVMKSSYYAMSLFEQLSAKLPNNTVLLSPHVIELDGQERLTSRPIASTETVPGAVEIDFIAYSFPDPDQMMKDKPVTFGDLMTPLLTVSTDHRARPGTHGLIMASEPLSAAAYAQVKSSANRSFGAIQSGSFEDAPRPLAMMAFLNGERARLPASHKLGKAARAKNSVEIYPLEKLRFSENDMAALRGAVKPHDPAASPFSTKVANHIVRILNKTDLSRAGMVGRAAAISRYDSNIAPFALAGETSSDFKARNRLASALISQERKVLAAQSKKLYDATYSGEAGEQMRELLRSEYQLIEDRREIAKQQNMATAASILGAIAAVGVASSGNNDNNGNNRANAQLARIIADLSMLAAQKSIALNRQSKAMGRNYRLAMAPVLSEQFDLQVDLLDGSEQISAASFVELQDKMQAAYSNKVRAMAQISSECAFKDSSGVTGRWQGECSGGLASGKGIGTVKRADGTAVEYYGNAANGLAQGVGYLIVQDSRAPYSVEGNFVAGQPHGPAYVIRSGGAETIRQFNNGQDAGDSVAGSLPPRLHDRLALTAPVS